MKKLLFILMLLVTYASQAQDASFGLTGSFGAYKTMVSSREHIGEDSKYGPGLQLELGAWMRLPVLEKGTLQFTILNTIERQSSGTIRVVDERGNDITDAKTRLGNLSVGATVLYLHPIQDKLSLGAGLGAKYKYASILVMEEIFTGYEDVGGNDYFNNYYHRKLKVYLPLEAQLALSERVQLVGQAQVPVNNRIAASQSAFKEWDLGLTVGVNYMLK